MKTVSLLLKRILNNPFMFILTVCQTAIISAAVLGVYNANVISHACEAAVQGENRMIYRSFSPDIEDEFSEKQIADIMSECKDYLGTSFVADSFTYLGENASLEIARKNLAGEYVPDELFKRSKYEDIAATYFYNEITLPLVIVTNSSLSEKYDIEKLHIRKNYFVFFDGKTTDEQMEKYAVMPGDTCAAVDKDMIISEELEITIGAEVSLPIAFCC